MGMPSGAGVRVAAMDNSRSKGSRKGSNLITAITASSSCDPCRTYPGARGDDAASPEASHRAGGGRLSGVFRGLALAGEEVEQLADGGLLAGRPGQRAGGLDLGAAAAAVPVLGPGAVACHAGEA